MNGQAQIPVVAPPNIWHMYRSMVGVGLFCGFLIVTVFQVTGPIIEKNKAEALQRAIFQVLPEAKSSKTFEVEGENVYAGYDDDKKLIGLALEAEGMGYQDVIRLLYGYSFAADAIVGIRVLESKETPGLGDKIETDPEFLKNFEKLDVTLKDDLSDLVHAIVPVKHGQKESPWEIDGITGATISSKAIANILQASASQRIPVIRKQLDGFEFAE
ncbi:MAG: FMN-binding protein [bacterium]|nr:FMN-binding protein [bacterium]